MLRVEGGRMGMVSPPFVISDEQIEETVGLLRQAIDEATQEIVG
jgi:adenosylmethionine-8-amino-7-oxononanoate aminotransferase